MFRKALPFVLAVATLGWTFAAPAAPETMPSPNASDKPEAFEFAMIGDYPYFPRDYAGMPHLLDDLRAEENLAWVLHLGDLHNPRNTECTEALFRERREWFTGLGKPFVLTPGDNDWADCKENPVAFMSLVRDIFFSSPGRVDGPDAFEVRPQSAAGVYPELVENVLWERGGVVFATMHMVRSAGSSFTDPLWEERTHLIEAGKAWLDEVFRVAKATNARGIFFATQVNPWPETGNLKRFEVLHPELLNQAPEFADFKKRLIEHAREFRGPIVMAHGDTHVFRIDKPLHDERLETIQNFTRVEGFGSPQGHWVRVRIDPDRNEVFSFQQEWVEENMYSLVPRIDRTDGFEDDSFGALLYVVRVIQWIPTLLSLFGAATLARLLFLAFRRWRARRASRAAGAAS